MFEDRTYCEGKRTELFRISIPQVYHYNPPVKHPNSSAQFEASHTLGEPWRNAMVFVESSCGSMLSFALKSTTSHPAICKIRMITLAVPSVRCQPQLQVSLSKTSLNVQKLKLWLSEIALLKFTSKLWIAPTHSNDTIASITRRIIGQD